MCSTDARIEADADDAPTVVVLYGPPAVGKTPVGRELSVLTGFRFFFNHVTVPAARVIFPDGQPQPAYTALLREWRLAGLAAAARAGVSLIFTVAYCGAEDDPFIDDLVATLRAHRGHTRFVELRAPEQVLMSRVGDASRTALGKMTDPQKLSELLATRDLTASVKYPSLTIRIDTTEHPPADTARRIAREFRLPTTTRTVSEADQAGPGPCAATPSPTRPAGGAVTR